MSRTVADTVERTLANAVDPRLDQLRGRSAKAEIHANPVVSTALVAIVQQAMSETDLSQKAFAINAGMPQSVVSEAFNGRRTFALVWVWAQDDMFVLRFFELAMQERHLTPEHRGTIRRKRIVELIDLILAEGAA